MQGLGPDHRLEWCIMEHHLRSQPPAQPSTTVPSSTSLHPMVPTTGWSETMQGREECPPCSDWKELEGGSRDCLPSLSPSGFSFSIQVFLSISYVHVTDGEGRGQRDSPGPRERREAPGARRGSYKNPNAHCRSPSSRRQQSAAGPGRQRPGCGGDGRPSCLPRGGTHPKPQAAMTRPRPSPYSLGKTNKKA